MVGVGVGVPALDGGGEFVGGEFEGHVVEVHGVGEGAGVELVVGAAVGDDVGVCASPAADDEGGAVGGQVAFVVVDVACDHEDSSGEVLRYGGEVGCEFLFIGAHGVVGVADWGAVQEDQEEFGCSGLIEIEDLVFEPGALGGVGG